MVGDLDDGGTETRLVSLLASSGSMASGVDRPAASGPARATNADGAQVQWLGAEPGITT
jgi:hypothetical protein